MEVLSKLNMPTNLSRKKLVKFGQVLLRRVQPNKILLKLGASSKKRAQ